MGGSSLCPEVLRRTFPKRADRPSLQVLDSTDPGAIRRLAAGLEIGRTFFLVSSKSGTTTETLCFHRYFSDCLEKAGVGDPGRRFAAITDPGSPLEDLARRRGFREIFLNPSDIGGRYSALSFFGLVPADLAGIDLGALLRGAERMIAAHAPDRNPEDVPGIVLGAVLAEMALAGRDKITLIASSPIESFGIWAEQLLAESTGKQGKGLIPVAGEPLAEPAVYGEDRLFVALLLPGEDPGTERALRDLEAAGQPVVVLRIDEPLDLGAEFYRWEVATAVAGSILGINPFDEPNVKESKDNTEAILKAHGESGAFPEEEPAAREDDLALFMTGEESRAHDVGEALGRFLGRIQPGDYFGIQAYAAPGKAEEEALDRIREAVRRKFRVATTVGFGPRYLHSTGQLHKGGPATGVFLQITADDGADLLIPGESYGFSVLERAQALGDLNSLRKKGRRVLRAHVGEPGSGLKRVAELTERVVRTL